MRFLSLALLLLLAGCGSAKDGGAKPQIRQVAGAPLTAVDSTVTLGTQVYARNLQAADTIVFRYFRNDSLLTARRRTVPTDNFAAGAPGYGQTASYNGTAQVERGGRTGSKFPAVPLAWAGGPLSYTRGPAPDPVIDSVVRITLRVVPRLDTIAKLGVVAAATRGLPYEPTDTNQAVVCAFGTTRSGLRVKLKNSWNRPTCERAYQAWLAELPA